MKQFVPNSDIYAVDALYNQPLLASIHLIKSNDRIAIVDTGTSHSVDEVNKALQNLGLNFDNVEFIILTHIHLDHAGGAGQLMQLCKNAHLIVHPKGARHMAEPQKLIDGTIAVYGEDKFKKLYGEILPIDKHRIIEPKDGETINFSGRELTFIDTPGHANHHHCIIDKQTNSVFTGDTLGVGYRALRDDDNVFLLASSTPVQFNPVALHQSINKVMSYKPEWLYLTHYSAVKPNEQMIANLHEQIDDFVVLTEMCANQNEDEFTRDLEQKMLDYCLHKCQNMLPNLSEDLIRKWTEFDAKLNVQGLVFWWNYRRAH